MTSTLKHQGWVFGQWIDQSKLPLAIGIVVLLAAGHSQAAVTLGGTSYTETFDGIGSGLPNGWTVRTGATAVSLGAEAASSSTAISWDTTTGNFRNCASADGMTGAESSAVQSGHLDRTLAIRQTGSFGDPGAAFVLQLANTTGFESFNLSLKAQMLSVQDRSTTWTFDYRIGDSGNFTTLGTYGDPGAFGSTTVSFDSSQLSAWNDQDSSIVFRIAALSGSTGSSSRDTFGIDDFALTFSAVPEPAEWGLISAAGLLVVGGFHSWRRRRGGANRASC
jgi:hypothetical protein